MHLHLRTQAGLCWKIRGGDDTDDGVARAGSEQQLGRMRRETDHPPRRRGDRHRRAAVIDYLHGSGCDAHPRNKSKHGREPARSSDAPSFAVATVRSNDAAPFTVQPFV